MKRHALRISLCMLLGVVTSIAVAWACAQRGTVAWTPQPDSTSRWVREVPPDWPTPTLSQQRVTFAITQHTQAFYRDPDRSDYSGVLLTVTLYGWPLRSMEHQMRNVIDGDDHNVTTSGYLRMRGLRRGLPVIPIYPGLLANTAIYGGVWWAMLFGPGMVIRWRRRRAGRCAKCGYDLRGAVVGDQSSVVGVVCPECGAKR